MLVAACAATLCLTGCAESNYWLAAGLARGQAVNDAANGLGSMLDRLSGAGTKERIAQLEAFYRDAGSKQEKQKLAYVLARQLQKLGNIQETNNLATAVERYEEASSYPALYQRAILHASECAQAAQDEVTVRRLLEQLAQSQNVKLKSQALYGLGQSYMRTMQAPDRERAAVFFNSVRELAPESNFATGSAYYLGNIAFAAGDNKQALALWREYLLRSPDGRFAKECLHELEANPEFVAQPSDYLLFAHAYFAAGDYQNAIKNWNLSGSAGSSDWLKRATSYVRIGQLKAATDSLFDGIKSHPLDAGIVPLATMLCRPLSRQDTINVWKFILASAPKARDASLYNLAIRSSQPEASTYFKLLLKEHPTSAFAPESSWWLAWEQIKGGRSGEALAICRQAERDYSHTKAAPRLAFWQGKLLERLGRKAEAQSAYNRAAVNYPGTYYGWRAVARAAALSGRGDRGWTTYPQRQLLAPEHRGWNWPQPPAEAIEQMGATISLLAELQQFDECLELLPERADPLVKAFFLARLNLPLEAINEMARNLGGAPHHNSAWQLAYPLLYAPEIATETRVRGIDPLLVQALIREESRYNHMAVSSSHALGLMQLLPGTAYGVAKRLGVHLASPADIHRPEINVKLGVDYLGYVLGRFNGNALFAVASYNGGPNAVKRWSQQFSGDLDTFVESIPYRETRDYVRKVFSSFWNYEAVYPSR